MKCILALCATFLAIFKPILQTSLKSWLDGLTSYENASELLFSMKEILFPLRSGTFKIL